ncbi:MAG TPA: 3-phosphoserine/phosphohydroxythreonine transaminase [Fimbriimonadaceae bacterium]|nr:3-phosphoserine/phosphohydroxythreonine transaminase [Fimbriimonadaceae bacterium]
MSQPYDRVFNFSAGPCTLPVEVLEEARDDLLNYKGAGMSVMEMSHRSKVYEGILAEAEADFRKLLKIPENYKVLFLGGGATLQFSMVPICFLRGGNADYVLTGSWGAKAAEAARLEGCVNVVFDGKPNNFREAPDFGSLKFDPKAAYVHFTSNETIQGVEFPGDPSAPTPLVCDMSSDILSRPVDISKYALIYAGAQKNMGPAGVAVIVIRDDMIAKVPGNMHPMLDYRLQAENGSMYNTPPCFNIYMCGLVYKYLLKNGGLNASRERAAAKAKILYDAIDGNGGFFNGHAAKDCRSVMNVTFTLPDEELTKTFVKLTEERKLDGLKGHRSVGGIRASIYNAFPEEGCRLLASTMAEFAKAHA